MNQRAAPPHRRPPQPQPLADVQVELTLALFDRLLATVLIGLLGMLLLTCTIARLYHDSWMWSYSKCLCAVGGSRIAIVVAFSLRRGRPLTSDNARRWRQIYEAQTIGTCIFIAVGSLHNFRHHDLIAASSCVFGTFCTIAAMAGRVGIRPRVLQLGAVLAFSTIIYSMVTLPNPLLLVWTALVVLFILVQARSVNTQFDNWLDRSAVGTGCANSPNATPSPASPIVVTSSRSSTPAALRALPSPSCPSTSTSSKPSMTRSATAPVTRSCSKSPSACNPASAPLTSSPALAATSSPSSSSPCPSRPPPRLSPNASTPPSPCPSTSTAIPSPSVPASASIASPAAQSTPAKSSKPPTKPSIRSKKPAAEASPSVPHPLWPAKPPDLPAPPRNMAHPNHVLAPRKLQVAAIDFLNPAPLMWDFEHPPLNTTLAERYDLHYTRPADCAARLLDGRADMGLIPIAALTPELAIVPNCTIASLHRVRSIQLVLKAPHTLATVRTVAADNASRSSLAYTQVLFRHFHANAPTFLSAPADPIPMLRQADAALLIGDPALLALEHRPAIEAAVGPCLWLDLAEQWHTLTGLPWVAAVWAVHPSALAQTTTDAAQLTADLTHSRDAGLAHIPALVGEWTPRIAIPPATIEHYLSRNIHYHLDSACLAAIASFRALAATVGALPPLGPLHLLA